jgi:hypothetical protein
MQRLTVPPLPYSFARAFSATPAPEQPEAPPERTHFGGLKDEDRIFTNLYGQHDPFLKVSTVSATQWALHFDLCPCMLCLPNVSHCTHMCSIGSDGAW